MVNWGILSTGSIAQSMTKSLHTVPDAQVLAVGSRTQGAAEEFGSRFNIPRRYGSYQALVDDPDIDVIYIATPHVFHAENMRQALLAGKHVLCEKPFTINAREAAECIGLARARGLLLVEAMWVRWLPTFVRFRDLLPQIGDLRLVRGNLCVRLDNDPEKRIYNPALGGGALLDVGVYPVSFASMVAGTPSALHSVVRMASTGVDESAALTFEYPNGAYAQLTCAVNYPAPQEFMAAGTDGTLQIREHFSERTLILRRSGQEPLIESHPFDVTDYRYQAIEVHDLLRAGKTESAVMPLDETLSIMQTMDALRAQWGFQYPGE